MYSIIELFYLINKINDYETGILDIIKYFTKSFTFISNKQLINAVNDHKKDKNKCENKYGSIKYWDTTKITNMSHLFKDYADFNEDISRWNVSKVTNMSYMFGYAISFNQRIYYWDISSVERMACMFFEAQSFDSKQIVGKWNIANVKYKQDMFYGSDMY